MPKCAAARCVSELNSIAFRKRDERLADRARCAAELLGGLGSLRVIVERHELQRDARILRILDQRFAALGLFDLARALQQAFRDRHMY